MTQETVYSKRNQLLMIRQNIFTNVYSNISLLFILIIFCSVHECVAGWFMSIYIILNDTHIQNTQNLCTQSVNDPIIYSCSDIGYSWYTVSNTLDGDINTRWNPAPAAKPNWFVVHNLKFVEGVFY